MKFLVFSLGGLHRNDVCYEIACRSTIGGLVEKYFFICHSLALVTPIVSFHTSQSLAAANVPLLFFTEWVLALFSYAFDGDFLNTFFDLFFYESVLK